MRPAHTSRRPVKHSRRLAGEGRIVMAQRHVQQAEEHVARQYELIERLALRGLPTLDAERFLDSLKAGLSDHKRDLRELVRQRDAGFRDDAGDLIP
jgi:hypothetical protein